MTNLARLRCNPPFASPFEEKELLVATLAQRRYTFFITADLHGPRTFDPIKDRLREWRNRVNRYYGGRRAVSPPRRARRMDGFVFFERGALRNSPHVHLVLDAPKLAEPTDFPLTAAAIWSSQYPEPTQIIRPYRAVTSGGKMQVDRIRDSPDDTTRVLHYVLKETERPHPDAEPFVHIEDI